MKTTPTTMLMLLLLLFSSEAVLAQPYPSTSDYIFWLVPSVTSASAGDTVTVDLFLQILPSAPGPCQGFTVGVCHDTNFLSLDSAVLGNWQDNLQGCVSADFLQFNTYGNGTPGGYTLATVFSFTGGCELLPCTHWISRGTYTCTTDVVFSNSVVSTCDTLGSPQTNTLVVENGVSYIPQQQFLNDPIAVECTVESPGQMQLNWVTNGIYESFEIICDGALVASLPGTATSYIHYCDPGSTACCTVVGIVCGISIVESEPCCCDQLGPCLEFEGDPEIMCNPNGGGHLLTFNFINLSGVPVHKVVIPGEVTTSSGTATVEDNVIVFASEIQPGDIGTIEVPITGAVAGDVILVPFALMHKDDIGNVEECCSDEISLDVPACFIRCDSNGDGTCDIADVITLLQYLFVGGPCSCLDACDCNDDDQIDIADGIYKLNFLFGFGPAPPPPHPSCGSDPTSGPLGCLSFPPCQ